MLPHPVALAIVPPQCSINGLGQGFSIENDCLTPTFKVRRPQLLQRYKAQIDAVYASQQNN
jgi:long-subunit acyl-CoA synthetase (AMP-forming)